MNQTQRNHVAMFTATQTTFNTHQAAIQAIPALAATTNQFSLLFGELTQVQMIQAGQTTGTSALKIKEEAEMIQDTVQMAAAIYVYAIDNNLPDLQARVSISPSELRQMNDEGRKTTCLNIHAEAAKLDGSLTEYGTTPEMIVKLKKEIDDFAALIASPRSAIVTRSQATARLAEIIDQMNHLLRDKADKLMLLLKQNNPEAYNAYKASRIIVDLRGPKKDNGDEE
ncbi:hypothetical protein DMA11_02110 [Marinilabiliaceae bacterium JC017]|nr:hypothetical protein DMA11_02110 [Marinilabiliaceae bacterium JC017]